MKPEALKQQLQQKLRRAHVSPKCIDFLQQLIVLDPGSRLTAAEALEHPWITDTGTAFGTRKQSSLGLKEGSAQISKREQSVVEAMRQFRTMSVLKRNAMMAMSSALSNSDLHKLNKSFAEIDTNKDGLISLEEFTAIFKLAPDALSTGLKDLLDVRRAAHRTARPLRQGLCL